MEKRQEESQNMFRLRFIQRLWDATNKSFSSLTTETRRWQHHGWSFSFQRDYHQEILWDGLDQSWLMGWNSLVKVQTWVRRVVCSRKLMFSIQPDGAGEEEERWRRHSERRCEAAGTVQWAGPTPPPSSGLREGERCCSRTDQEAEDDAPSSSSILPSFLLRVMKSYLWMFCSEKQAAVWQAAVDQTCSERRRLWHDEGWARKVLRLQILPTDTLLRFWSGTAAEPRGSYQHVGSLWTPFVELQHSDPVGPTRILRTGPWNHLYPYKHDVSLDTTIEPLHQIWRDALIGAFWDDIGWYLLIINIDSWHHVSASVK